MRAGVAARPSLRDRMLLGYAAAGIFALEEWAQANKSVAMFEWAEGDVPDFSRDRYSAALRRAAFWEGEADRCEAIVQALDGMGDGQ